MIFRPIYTWNWLETSSHLWKVKPEVIICWWGGEESLTWVIPPPLEVLYVCPRHPNTYRVSVFGWCVLGVQMPSQEVFGCLGSGLLKKKLTWNVHGSDRYLLVSWFVSPIFRTSNLLIGFRIECIYYLPTDTAMTATFWWKQKSWGRSNGKHRAIYD